MLVQSAVHGELYDLKSQLFSKTTHTKHSYPGWNKLQSHFENLCLGIDCLACIYICKFWFISDLLLNLFEDFYVGIVLSSIIWELIKLYLVWSSNSWCITNTVILIHQLSECNHQKLISGPAGLIHNRTEIDPFITVNEYTLHIKSSEGLPWKWLIDQYVMGTWHTWYGFLRLICLFCCDQVSCSPFTFGLSRSDT